MRSLHLQVRSTAADADADGLISPFPPSSSPPPTHSRIQSAAAGGAGETQEQQQQGMISVDSDMVVILASLLCALICVAGLALVARCACRRPRTTTTTSSSSFASTPFARPTAPRGLKKKAIQALPTVCYKAPTQQQLQVVVLAGECAICLAEFAEGDDLRVLPHCAHAFHVACIDTWLAAHATCPSCRSAIIASSPSPPGAPRCRTCGATCDLDSVDVDHASASSPPPPPAAAAAVVGDES
ncbi:hypothetical protein ACP70R_049779 [Stipagrostis hirtigluma subsp. patula]